MIAADSIDVFLGHRLQTRDNTNTFSKKKKTLRIEPSIAIIQTPTYWKDVNRVCTIISACTGKIHDIEEKNQGK